MIIKKFQGKTEADAIEAARKELGGGVVVMNVRSVKKKGFFSFLSPHVVEITVALEEENERYGAGNIRKEPPEPVYSPAASRIMKPELIPGDGGGMGTPGEDLLFANQPAGNPGLNGIDRTIAARTNRAGNAAGTGNNVLEEKLDNLHSLLEQQLQRPAEEDKTENEEPEVQSEIMIFMRLLYNTMLDNEVNEKYANQIIEEIEKSNKPNIPFDHALSSTYQKMILKFGKPEIIAPAQNGPKVVFFVGPTGVGKTTTIAKIASRFRVEEHRKVVLLTADTYRIAAAEQLRTYANILEVPFRIIYAREEIQQAVRDFKDYDFILVDTAGHSHQNESQRKNMSSFIHSVDDLAEREVFLVLSATTKYRDLISISDTYREMADFKLIFTKLDETTTLGNLLNLKLYTGAPLSYMTYGQNVPDDIEDFNPQKTVKQLLGGKN